MALLRSLCSTSAAAYLTTEHPSTRSYPFQNSLSVCSILSVSRTPTSFSIQAQPCGQTIVNKNRKNSASKFVLKCVISTTQEQILDPLQADVSAENQVVETESEEFSRDRLVAQNIPWTSTPEDIRSLFEKHGRVLDVELPMHNKSRNRGLAFVTMKSPETAQVALNNLDASEFEGRILKIEYARIRREKRQPSVSPKAVTYALFVANLAFEARAKHLKEFFQSKYSGVVSASVIFEGNPRNSAGYGFVSFSSKKEAEDALASLEGKEFMGRPIKVSRSRPFVRFPVEAQPEDKSSNLDSIDSEVGSA